MKLFLFFLLIVLNSTVTLQASTNNVQTFELLSVAGSDTTTVVIQENVTGESSPYPEGDLNKYIITCFPNDSTFEKVLNFIAEDSTELDSADVVTLTEVNGKFHLPDGGVFVPPPRDILFPKRYEEIAASSSPKFWYQNCKSDCLRGLRFSAVNARRICFNRRGLYIDYAVKEAYYYKPGNLLIILTNQPHLAAGLDTMHGVLLYRVIHE